MKLSTALFWLTVARCSVAPVPAFADNPITPSEGTARHPNQAALQRTRLGNGRTVQIGADANWTCWAMPDQDDADTCTTTCGAPQIIPFYSVVQVATGASGGWLCFTQTPSGADIALDTGTGVLTDAQGTDGSAGCFYVPPNNIYAEVLDAALFRSTSSSVLRRSGVCETAGGVEYSPGRPCRVNADCGSGTDVCDLTPEGDPPGGAYLCGQDVVNGFMLDINGVPSSQ